MSLHLTDAERAEIEAAQRASRSVRHWRRYQAVLLRGQGLEVVAVARALGCTATSVCTWTAAWHRAGVAGLAEGRHPGGARRLDAAGERALDELLEAGDPQAHGDAATAWTVPLLRTELARRGWEAGARTLRRTLHRLGWRWKRPRFVLGRPDPAYEQNRGGSWSKSPPR